MLLQVDPPFAAPDFIGVVATPFERIGSIYRGLPSPKFDVLRKPTVHSRDRRPRLIRPGEATPGRARFSQALLVGSHSTPPSSTRMRIASAVVYPWLLSLRIFSTVEPLDE